MRYPTNWISITQGFHVGKCLDFGWCSHHNQDIYACDDGVVMPLEKQEKGGNVIYIQHDNGMVSFYAHLKAFAVKKGQRVSLGQKIGIMGKTGKGATGEHLHFGLFKNYNSRYKNSTINPFDDSIMMKRVEVKRITIPQADLLVPMTPACRYEWEYIKSMTPRISPDYFISMAYKEYMEKKNAETN